MEGYRLRSAQGDTIDPRQPLVVDSVEAQETASTTPTLTYNGKAAAGAITINSLTSKPVISITGDQVASYWGNVDNKVYEAYSNLNPKHDSKIFSSLTETNGGAAIVINDPNNNLENLFESVNGTVKRFIAKAIDTKGKVLYGWVKGVSVSGNDYTFEIVNNRLTETQNWVGTLADFNDIDKIEIYRYNSSIAFGTGTTLTEEVGCPREYSKSWDGVMAYASTLTNGQYFIDYMRGRIVGKKADGTASETATYNVWATTTTGGGTVAAPAVVQGTTAAGSTATGNPVQVGGIYHSATPTYVNGQAGPIELDSSGNQNVNVNKQFAGEDLTEKVMKTVIKVIANGTYCDTSFQNLGANATLSVKSSAGVVTFFKMRNTTSQPRYMQLHNTATTPSGGAVPLFSELVPAGQCVVFNRADFGPAGKKFITGIAFACSLAEATYSAATATDHITYIDYV